MNKTMKKCLMLITLIPFCLFTTSSLALPIMAYQEADLNLGNGMIGTICKPTQIKKSPVVLLLHGFASKKNEVGNLSLRLAHQLCEKGIGSLRIAFRGWGESAGKMTAVTVDTEVEDAENAYHYLSSQSWVDSKRLGIAGFSMGGGIAMIQAGQRPNRYKSMVTWSSVGHFRNDFLKLLGQARFEKAATEGSVEIDFGWRQVTLGHAFFTSLDHYDLSQLISRYTGNYLAIAGSDDFSAAYTKLFVDSAPAQLKQALIIPRADHIFGVLGEDQSTAEYVLSKTVNWFEQTL
jgi:alpha/beta superfamily hydrolase